MTTGALLIAAGTLGLATAPSASANEPLANPSITVTGGCAGARTLVQIYWHSSNEASIHWTLTDTDRGDGRPPVLRMNAVGADGAQPFVFSTGETAAVLHGDTVSGGEDTWNPSDIAQFRRLQIITQNGNTASGVECSTTKSVYNFSRVAYHYSLDQIDNEYEWGTEGPSTFDCSGLVYHSYNRVPDLPSDWSRKTANSYYSWAVGEAANNESDNSNLEPLDVLRVPASERQVGDLVFYEGHVGFYAGDGRLYSALNETVGIDYTSVDILTRQDQYYYRIVGVRSSTSS
ncbi:C40 family peptidase [Streptomyces sp. NBC_00038]|uniref:C40 family peptidase n=1 Tax=Streptomyces sp. NBC_00038 TaxID=2903615 RepID=UPI00224FB720|nr:NlpC/P60 family protein [Streptomyces sp. NBC_00038]MCX5562992.1 C40 family peptidase [Streptomyces sp. NBC_00038]